MKHSGTILILTGLLLLGAALGLVFFNLQRQDEARDDSTRIVSVLLPQIETRGKEAEKQHNDLPEQPLPYYLRNPDIEMPVVEIEGNDYIGVLSIPTLELSLPVMSEWSYDRLRIAPCRYYGSAYRSNLVIAAHNYSGHFGRLSELKLGDNITFTDMDGNVFRYEVLELEQLASDAGEDMVTGDWDLTLFTCTIGGAMRIAVRCVQTE